MIIQKFLRQCCTHDRTWLGKDKKGVMRSFISHALEVYGTMIKKIDCPVGPRHLYRSAFFIIKLNGYNLIQPFLVIQESRGQEHVLFYTKTQGEAENCINGDLPGPDRDVKYDG